MEERKKNMIHETLKSRGGIREIKGHDQEIIVALMSVKFYLGDVFLFHTYLVVDFGKVFIPTVFFQKVIYDGNREFVLNGKYVEGTQIKTHVPSSFIIEEHDHGGRIGASTIMDNTPF
jgi:hypothetical protein